MGVIYDSLFQGEHQHMTTLLIPLCKNSTDIYHVNILGIPAIIIQIYIECEGYNLAYINKTG